MDARKPLMTLLVARRTPVLDALLAVAACVFTTAVTLPLSGILDLANMVMLFLLTVLLVAVTLGRDPAVLAAVLSVLLFDVFFVEPRYSLAVSNLQYVITFAVMLVTALITGHLAAGLKQQVEDTRRREQRTQALYETARRLAGAIADVQVGEIAADFVQRQLGGVARLVRSDDGLDDSSRYVAPRMVQAAMQDGCWQHDHSAAPGQANYYFPLCAPMQVRGVLAVGFADPPSQATPETLALLDALASLLAIAVERLHYVEVAQASEMSMLSERLRNSILSALSHDLRTPLTALGGLAETLSLIRPALPQPALDTAQAIHEQATRLSALVGKLLDLARLKTGDVHLRREWQPLEEVIGASIKLLAGALVAHPVRVSLAAELPLLAFDALLLERVFCNLLENAAKFSPPGSAIEVRAERHGDVVEVSVCDRGPGFPAGCDATLFQRFERGGAPADTPGSGLGLAICSAIIAAHDGAIEAGNRTDGGACVRFRLPVGTPPVIEAEPA